MEAARQVRPTIKTSLTVTLFFSPSCAGSDGERDSALPSEAQSMVLEYVQTFGYHHKKPGDPDSGIGTKTKTGSPTIRSHITEVNNKLVHASSTCIQ